MFHGIFGFLCGSSLLVEYHFVVSDMASFVYSRNPYLRKILDNFGIKEYIYPILKGLKSCIL